MQPLIVPGKLESLEKIRKYILLASKNAGLEKARAYKLSLAVDEIATNIINYGYHQAGLEGEISVEADLDEHALTITLEDTSGYFDPTLKPPPPPEDFTQPLGDRAIGGWGVYLALQSVDKFNYRRIQDHNHNIFIMFRATHGDLLVIDSFSESCTTISQHLASLGYTVMCAENGLDALALFQQRKIELVLLNLPMKDRNAVDFIVGMKADNALRNIPVIILTNPEQQEEAERCIKSGAEDYIVLPFSQVVLEVRVRAILERQRVRIAEQNQKETMKYERDLQIGRMVQLFFLPENLPEPPGWEIAARFVPGSDVSGVFYDTLTLPENYISLIMGDVCDHGITAALFMVLFRSLLRAYTQSAYHYLPDSQAADSSVDSNSSLPATNFQSEKVLKNAIELTNHYIVSNHDTKKISATIFYGILDISTGRLIYINAGHVPPLIFNQDGVKVQLKQTGSALGLALNTTYPIHQIQMDPGDTLLIFSEGVIAAKDPSGQSFGRNILLNFLDTPDLSVTALLNRIETDLQTHIGDADQVEDLTIFAINRPA